MRWGISVPSQPPFAVAQMIAGVADSVAFESLWLWAAGRPAGPSSPVSHNDQGVSHVGCAMGRGER